MGLLNRLLSPVGPSRFSQPSETDDFWYNPVPFGSNASGIRLSPESALQATAVYACVRIRSATVAMLPLFLFQRLVQGRNSKERAYNHALYFLLHNQPNPEMTSFRFREYMEVCRLLRGNSYAWIERDYGGQVRALWPIHPDRMKQPKRDAKSKQIVYEVRLEGGERKRYPPNQILHIRGLSTDGVVGLSRIGLGMQSVGLSLASEQYGAAFFGSGGMPIVALKHPRKLTPDAKKDLREGWFKDHGGVTNFFNPAILEGGLELEVISIKPEEAQFLETRKFQVSEIARLFGIPPYMIGDVEKSTSWGTGIEQQSIGYLTYSIAPDLVNIEQELNRTLLTINERSYPEYFMEFQVNALLRADAKTRGQFYRIMRDIGVYNADEIRDLENLNPIPQGLGEDYWRPKNMEAVGGGDSRSSDGEVETQSGALVRAGDNGRFNLQ